MKFEIITMKTIFCSLLIQLLLDCHSRTRIHFLQESCRSETLDIFFQDHVFSSKIMYFLPRSYIIFQDQTFSSQVFLDTCKNNALSSKMIEVKCDRFLQKMYGSSTGVGNILVFRRRFFLLRKNDLLLQ